MKTIQAAALLSLSVGSVAFGQQALQWKVSDGGNGHWYAYFTAPKGWNDAEAYAESLGGHLVTLRTSAEANIVRSLGSGSCWIGLFQDRAAPDYSEPSGGWRWITNEPLDFTNWRVNAKGQPNEPNDLGGGEDWAHLDDNAVTWNDLPDRPFPFAVEWDADCNNDGIVDYGQCRDGSLPDYNGNNIPDCCEQGTPCVPSCHDADFFRDFNVNGADLGILLSQWGPNTPFTVSDLTGDGAVNGDDLGIFLSYWGPCPN
jgi:hypothetical protein